MTNENLTFDKSSLCAQLFRSAVKEVLPISVQGKLRDIPGLDEMVLMVIRGLKEAGILVTVKSACNTPILPVKKNKRRMENGA